jgi:hypothetical protein
MGNLKHLAISAVTTAVVVAIIFRVKAIRTAVTGLA